MAFDYVLSLTDGTTTITLTSSPFKLRDYQPKTAERKVATVSESVEFRLADGSPANNLDELSKLHKLMLQAEEAAGNRAIAPVYLNWKDQAAGSIWRSKVRAARGEWGADALSLVRWLAAKQTAALYWERDNFWEGPEAQVPLNASTNPLTITNDLANNTAAIDDADVTGDLPGATRLELTNSFNNATGLGTAWIGQNWTDPANFAPALTAASSPYTVASGTTPVLLETWTLSAANISAARGMFVKALGYFPTIGVSGSMRFRCDLYDGVQEIFRGAWSAIDGSSAFAVRELGTFRLPPWLINLSGLKALSLRLYGIQTSGSPITVTMPKLYLLPVDGYRYFNILGSVAYQGRIVDDGLTGNLYADDGNGASRIGAFAQAVSPIRLRPGLDQKLYFVLHSTAADTAESTRTVSVKLYYRPRKLTI